MKKMMTDAEYVANKGLQCPRCGHGELDTKDPEFNNIGAKITVAVTCRECEYEYVEIFHLTGYLDK